MIKRFAAITLVLSLAFMLLGEVFSVCADELQIEVVSESEFDAASLNVRHTQNGINMYGTAECNCRVFIKVTDEGGNVLYLNQYRYTSGEVTEMCNFVKPTTGKLYVRIYSSNLDVAEIFVSSVNGNDSNSGTINSPFKTVDKARQEIENRRKSTNTFSNYVVYLREGIYSADSGSVLSLSAADSGNADVSVTYSAYNNENAVLSGGINISSEDFNSVTDTNVLERLPVAAASKVLYADLAAMGITDYGSVAKYGHNASNTALNGMELFIDEKAMTLARWPNEGFSITGYTSEHAGNVTKEDIAVECLENGKTANWVDREGNLREADGKIEIFTSSNWGSRVTNLVSVNAETGYFNIEKLSGGTINPIPMNARYFVFNILEELDTPGEYYIDRENGRLYLYPNGSLTESSDIGLSLSDSAVLSINGASNISFEGITFENSRLYDVSMEASDNIRFRNCVFRNSGNIGVFANDCTNINIIDSEVYNTGRIGIYMSGGDTDYFVSSENLIDNCKIYNTTRCTSSSGQGVYLIGMGGTVRNSELYNMNHTAIAFNGLEHRISGNEIYDVCKTVMDAGAIYSGRKITTRGNIVEKNYIHDVYGCYNRQVFGIYLDDKLCENSVTENAFVNMAGGIKIAGGRKVTVADNFMYNCDTSIWYPSYISSEWWNKSGTESSNVYVTVNSLVNKAGFIERYPDAAYIFEDENPSYPKYSSIYGNMIYNSGEPLIEQEVIDYADRFELLPVKDIALHK